MKHRIEKFYKVTTSGLCRTLFHTLFNDTFSTFSQPGKLSFIGFLFQSSCPREGNYVKVSQIEIEREVVRPSMVFPTVIQLHSIFYSYSAMQSCHMSIDGEMAQDFPQPTGFISALSADMHYAYHRATSDRVRLGAFNVVASNNIAVLYHTPTDGRVRLLTSTHDRPTDGVARAGWRRAIHE
jgi:hypothetical protein